jgi:hypothetical protein
MPGTRPGMTIQFETIMLLIFGKGWIAGQAQQ